MTHDLIERFRCRFELWRRNRRAPHAQDPISLRKY